MHQSKTTYALMILLLTAASACSSPEPKNGAVRCGAQPNPCPANYYCYVGDNTCWRNGDSPDAGPGGKADGPSGTGDADAAGSDDTNRDRPTSDATGDGSSTVDSASGDSNAVDSAEDVVAPADVPSNDGPSDAQNVDLKKDVASDGPTSPTDVTQDLATCPANKVACGAKCIDPPPLGCCAATDCTGACTTCGTNNTCVAVTGRDDPSCTGTCDATGACKSKKGQPCTAVGGGCAAGTACSLEGICCNTACTGSCEACDVAGSEGTCTTLPANAAPRAGHTACAGTGACAGKCDGTSPACAYSTGTCDTATCISNVFQAAGTCSAGTCTKPAPKTCTNACVLEAGGCSDCTPGAKQCSPTAPNTPQLCQTNGTWLSQTACGNGNTCVDGSCVCVAPKAVCNGVCVDTQSDGNHCGSCGHSCQGGTCSVGLCQPVVVESGINAGNIGALNLIGIDSTKLYYTAFRNDAVYAAFSINKNANKGTGTMLWDGGSAGIVPLAGATSSKILMNTATPLTMCNTSSCASSLATLPANTDSYTRFAEWHSNPPTHFPAYGNDYGTGGLYIIWMTSATSEYDRTYDSTNDGPNTSYPSLMAGGDTLYFVRHYNTEYNLYSIAPNASVKVKLAGGLSESATIVDVNDKSVLLVDSNLSPATLFRVPLTGATSPQALVTSSTGLSTLATEDASWVYWLDGDNDLKRCSPSNCGSTTTTLLCGQSAQERLLQDSTNLYWVVREARSIMRLAK